RAQRALTRVDWHEVSFGTLSSAMQRSYKRARRAMETAQASDDSELFHAWRRRTKTLWYALRLVERAMPRVHRAVVRLDQLDTWLGDDHNVEVLHQRTYAGLARDARRREAMERKAAHEHRS